MQKACILRNQENGEYNKNESCQNQYIFHLKLDRDHSQLGFQKYQFPVFNRNMVNKISYNALFSFGPKLKLIGIPRLNELSINIEIK